MIVLDDMPANSELLEIRFNRAKKSGIEAEFVSIGVNYGSDVVSLFKAFKEADSGENPSIVVLALDGNLDPGDKYQFGYNVAQDIADISNVNNWPIPLIVGLSDQNERNQALETQFPNNYVTSYGKTGDFLPMLKAIADKLTLGIRKLLI